MLRSTFEKLVVDIPMDLESSANYYFNIVIQGADTYEKFYIQLDDGQLDIRDGMHVEAIGLLNAKESTLSELMDMGANLIGTLLDVSIRRIPDRVDLPDIEPVISVSTEINNHPVNFNVFIEQGRLNVIEEYDTQGDIRIRIKPSYLPKLFKGKINIPMALLTGKIKIQNKAELFKLLASLGLKI